MRKPRVAVTTWRRCLPTYLSSATDLFTLGSEYIEALRTAGAVCLLVGGAEPGDAETILEQVDGLVLTGGGDIDPRSYGAGHDPGAHDHDADADRFEIALVREARRRRLPTLAICRGMQVLNVALGGDLRAEITADGSVHSPISDDPSKVLAASHLVRLRPQTRLAEIYGPCEQVVNTIHHQGLRHVAPELTVSAIAPDGVVEAVEGTGTWKVLGVQWHPEKRLGAGQALFDAFVASLGVFK